MLHICIPVLAILHVFTLITPGDYFKITNLARFVIGPICKILWGIVENVCGSEPPKLSSLANICVCAKQLSFYSCLKKKWIINTYCI